MEVTGLFVDQCNNPKTKEPKLDAAMRIIPEWKDRDAEIRRLWDNVYSQESSSASSTTSSTSSGSAVDYVSAV